MSDRPIHHLNQVQLARRWSLSPRTLERWRWHDQGPCYLKIGGRVVYRIEDVEAFETASAKQPAATPSKGAEHSNQLAMQPQRGDLPIGETHLIGWLLHAAPGDRLTYWRGYLAQDRCSSAHEGDRLAGLGRLTWDLAQEGWIHLVQRRVGPRDFAYIAIARPRPCRPTEMPSAVLAGETA